MAPRFPSARGHRFRRETRDAVVVTLARPRMPPRPLTSRQGQYLTFRRDFDGEELRRSYSICAGQGRRLLRVGIKRSMAGAFSSYGPTRS